MKFKKWIKSFLFFGYILTIFNEGLIDIIYIVYMNYQTVDYSTNGEIFTSSFMYFCILMIMIILPAVNIWVQVRSFKYLNKARTKVLIGILYLDNKFKRPLQKFYVLHYFLRRFFYVSLGIFLTGKDAGIK